MQQLINDGSKFYIWKSMNASYWPLSATYVASIYILVFCTSPWAFNSDTEEL